jgi:hypothetical protein
MVFRSNSPEGFHQRERLDASFMFVGVLLCNFLKLVERFSIGDGHVCAKSSGSFVIRRSTLREYGGNRGHHDLGSMISAQRISQVHIVAFGVSSRI